MALAEINPKACLLRPRLNFRHPELKAFVGDKALPSHRRGSVDIIEIERILSVDPDIAIRYRPAKKVFHLPALRRVDGAVNRAGYWNCLNVLVIRRRVDDILHGD